MTERSDKLEERVEMLEFILKRDIDHMACECGHKKWHHRDMTEDGEFGCLIPGCQCNSFIWKPEEDDK